MFELPFPLVLILVFVAMAADVTAGSTWWPPYFRHGIPLFVRRRPLADPAATLPPAPVVEARVARPWITPLLVRALSGTELAVREKYWGNPFRLSYTPLAHGLVVLDPLARELRLEARLNASTVAFAVLAWKAVASFGDLGTNLFLIGLVAGLVALQVWRYGEVLTATARAAERTS